MEATDHPIEEGALQAYLEGERQPEVVEALARSPELQRELALLARANERLHALAPKVVIPGDQDLIDVAAGQATPSQQLRVAAYLRESASGRAQMAYLLEGDRARRRGAPALFLAAPLPFAAAVKSQSADDAGEPVFVASELAAHIVVRIQPVDAGSWRLRGYLEQRGEPLQATQVVLRAAAGRRRTRVTDEGGFFTFDRLPAGSYHVRVALETGVLLTPPIALSYEH